MKPSTRDSRCEFTNDQQALWMSMTVSCRKKAIQDGLKKIQSQLLAMQGLAGGLLHEKDFWMMSNALSDAGFYLHDLHKEALLAHDYIDDRKNKPYYQNYLKKSHNYCRIHQEAFQSLWDNGEQCESCLIASTSPLKNSHPRCAMDIGKPIATCACCHSKSELVEQSIYCRHCYEIYNDERNS